jgi:hypothetical protein
MRKETILAMIVADGCFTWTHTVALRLPCPNSKVAREIAETLPVDCTVTAGAGVPFLVLVSGEERVRKILGWMQEDAEILHFGSSVCMTPNHPVLVKDSGFIPVSRLIPGDQVLTDKGWGKLTLVVGTKDGD